MKLQALKGEEIATAVDFCGQYPSRIFGMSIPLPGWDTGLHIGSFVTSEKQDGETVYTVVDVVGDVAILVPVLFPVCAYACEVRKLRRVATPWEQDKIKAEGGGE